MTRDCRIDRNGTVLVPVPFLLPGILIETRDGGPNNASSDEAPASSGTPALSGDHAPLAAPRGRRRRARPASGSLGLT